MLHSQNCAVERKFPLLIAGWTLSGPRPGHGFIFILE